MPAVNSSEVFTVFRKEFIETARDWRTLCVGDFDTTHFVSRWFDCGIENNGGATGAQ